MEDDLRPGASLLRAMFTHQLSHLWIDVHAGLRDSFFPVHDRDYFENTRQATYVHQEYARRNPLEFAGYGQYCWGITATDGPGWETRRVNGIERQFFGYHARGAPYGPDDGTLAPWVAVASLPFAPEIVIPTIRAMARLELGATSVSASSLRSTRPTRADGPTGWWVSPTSFRHRPRSGGPDDRELPHRLDLGDHAPLPLREGRTAPRGLPWQLALKRVGDSGAGGPELVSAVRRRGGSDARSTAGPDPRAAPDAARRGARRASLGLGRDFLTEPESKAL